MKLKSIIIKGFRCFNEKTIININDDFSALIGTNSSGKSACLEAILKILSPNYQDRALKKSDFFSDSDESADSKELSIELDFEFDELKNGDNLDAIPIYFRNMVVEIPGGLPFVKICLLSEWKKSANPDGSIESKIVYLDADNKEKETVHREELDNIRVFYVPAFRDIEKELKYVSGSLIHRIYDLIVWSDDKIAELSDKSKELNNLISNYDPVGIINKYIKGNWSNFNLDDRFKEAKLEFSSSELSELLKKSIISFYPGVDKRNFDISEFGDGSKSILYFSLVKTLINLEHDPEIMKLNEDIETPFLTLLLFEEPENHVAPHMFGQLINTINEIVKNDNAQSIITTHSPAIINKVDPECIRLFRMNNFSTMVTSIDIPKNEIERYKFIKDDFRKNPFVYFSKLVIIVEGDSEQYILPKFLKLKNLDFDEKYITIFSLNSRFVSGAWKLFSNLRIPYLTYIDLDNERSCGGYNKIATIFENLKEANKLEDVYLESGKKLFKDHIIDKVKKYKVDKNIRDWVSYLNNNHNVFFSEPIDVDFVMLKNYKDLYIKSLEKNEGPIVKGVGKVKEIEDNGDFTNASYISKKQNALEHVLKDGGGDGSSFTEEEKRLMIWYDYFFLSNSKPVSHFKALNDINDTVLNENIPDCINKLIEAVKNELSR